MVGCSESDVQDSAPAEVKAEPAKVSGNPLASLDYEPIADAHHDDGGRVAVELSAAWSDEGQLVIRGVFTPDDAGYHLYSKTLPKEGISGLGRPTLIELEPSDLIADVDALIADKPEMIHVEEVLNLTFPIYPDGPVALYLPVRFQTPPQEPTSLNVKLTYMACSENRCHSPVEGELVQVTVPPPE